MGQPPSNASKVIDVKANEILILSNLYLNGEWPYNYITLGQVAGLLNASKNTGINVMRELEQKGLVVKQNSFITFYYPVNDPSIKQQVLRRLGIIK